MRESKDKSKLSLVSALKQRSKSYFGKRNIFGGFYINKIFERSKIFLMNAQIYGISLMNLVSI